MAINFKELLPDQFGEVEKLAKEVGKHPINEKVSELESLLNSAVNSVCMDFIAKINQEKQALIKEGEQIADNIIFKERTFANAASIGLEKLLKWLQAPYTESVKRLRQKENEVNQMYALKIEEFNKLLNECEKISLLLGNPNVTHLSKIKLNELEVEYGKLIKLYNANLAKRDILVAQCEPLNKFMQESLPDYAMNLDEASLVKFSEHVGQLNTAYQQRMEKFNSLISKIKLLATTLDLTVDIGDETDGSDERYNLLNEKVNELHQLKLEQLPKIIPAFKNRVQDLYRDMCLDTKLRVELNQTDYSFENLQCIENEISRLELMRQEPRRALVLAELDKYKEMRVIEAELKLSEKDKNRFSCRNFREILNREETLRKLITHFKPEILKRLNTLIKRFALEQDNEQFFLENTNGELENLNLVLQEEFKRMPKLHSLQRIEAAGSGPKAKLTAAVAKLAHERLGITLTNVAKNNNNSPNTSIRPRPQSQPRPRLIPAPVTRARPHSTKVAHTAKEQSTPLVRRPLQAQLLRRALPKTTTNHNHAAVQRQRPQPPPPAQGSRRLLPPTGRVAKSRPPKVKPLGEDVVNMMVKVDPPKETPPADSYFDETGMFSFHYSRDAI